MRTKTERPIVALFAVMALVLCLGLLMANWQMDARSEVKAASVAESSTAVLDS